MATLKARYHKTLDAKGKRKLKGYYAAFRRPGAQPPCKEVALGTKDPKTANTRLVDLERREAHGTFDPWVDATPWKEGAPGTRGALTVAEAVKRYTDARHRVGVAASSLDNDRRQLAPFVDSLPPGLLLSHLAPSHVAAYLSACASRGLRPATLESYATRLRAFAQWCRRSGLVPASWAPVPETARGTRSVRIETAPKYFTEAEAETLVAEIRDRATREGASHFDRLLFDVVPFAIGSGLRLAELCALRWEDVARDAAGRAFVHIVNSDVHTTKSGRVRTVPLFGGALEAFERRRAAAEAMPAPPAFIFPSAAGGQVRGEYLSKTFVKVVHDVFGETDRRNFHSLRHSFGTHAAGRGVALYALQEMMGHAATVTTTRYAKLRPVDLHGALSTAFGVRKLARKRRRARPRPQ